MDATQRLQYLQSLKAKLRKYCHADGCTGWRICPEVCCREGHGDNIDPMLNLDTAIAWQASRVIHNYMMNYKSREEVVFGLYCLAKAVEFHKEEYSELYLMLMDAHNAFYA